MSTQPVSALGDSGFTLRHGLRPGDLGRIVELHGVVYAREHGFDASFEPYVAAPLAQFAMTGSGRDRVWVLERDGKLAGCIAVVGATPRDAQLRWFLIDPSARGLGLGRSLLETAIDFAREQGYESVFLWTVNSLEAAIHLYLGAGFRKVAQKKGGWGVEVVEEQYVLELGDSSRGSARDDGKN